jgi:hypothetical protein
MCYVTMFDDPDGQYCFSRILLHIGNSGDPTAEIGVIASADPEEQNLGE